MTMKWESPSYVELRMDAEIGSYQDDLDPPNHPINVDVSFAAKPHTEAPSAECE
jgi:hypothetical protein